MSSVESWLFFSLVVSTFRYHITWINFNYWRR